MRINPESLEYLRNRTLKVLKKCEAIQEIDLGEEKVRLVLHVPSGDMKYTSFWVRDSVMMASTGLIPECEMKGWLWLIAYTGQNGPENINLENGLKISPWAIADHINFDGRPVFYPGTYDSGNNQGKGEFGYYPPHDNQYYFIELAYLYYFYCKDNEFLNKKIKGITLIQRLENAFASFNVDGETQLCFNNLHCHTVDWGFCDQVTKSGYLLFPSLLRYQSALRFSALFRSLKNEEKAEYYSCISFQIRKHAIDKFYDESGWLLSSTGVCRQKDVWGTAFALYLDFLDEPYKLISAQAITSAYKDGTAVDNGYVRHILVGEDASNVSAWERTFCLFNTYQNGGYWSTPTGWYIYGLSIYSTEIAIQMFEDFIKHCKRYEENGAPFEWRTLDDSLQEGKMYGASAALPYKAILRLTI